MVISFASICKRDSITFLASPTVLQLENSSERQHAQTSEALVVEESTETYYWILQSMHKMESRWSLSSLRIVFGDHKVSMSLMTALGIQETCLLRGDYYHNMSEVFPKKFDQPFFARII
jgi:hypothetical protein